MPHLFCIQSSHLGPNHLTTLCGTFYFLFWTLWNNSDLWPVSVHFAQIQDVFYFGAQLTAPTEIILRSNVLRSFCFGYPKTPRLGANWVDQRNIKVHSRKVCLMVDVNRDLATVSTSFKRYRWIGPDYLCIVTAHEVHDSLQSFNIHVVRKGVDYFYASSCEHWTCARCSELWTRIKGAFVTWFHD
jgi:hypothetical protein